MATQEIRSADWENFCAKFLHLHQGSIMCVTQVNGSGTKIEAVHEMPLRNISFKHEGCNDRILLSFQEEGTREITHEIIDPIHVKLREEEQGSKGLQIDAESGSTLILFSSGKLNELLHGMAIK